MKANMYLTLKCNVCFRKSLALNKFAFLKLCDYKQTYDPGILS